MSKAPAHTAEAPDDAIDVTLGEWGMIIVTGFIGVFFGPFAIIPGAVVVGMFTYRLNPELMRATKVGQWVRGVLPAPADDQGDQDDQHEQTDTLWGSASAASVVAPPTAPARTAQRAPVVTAATPAPAVTMITLSTLARCSTILLVGSRGSGKTTLLNAILRARSEAIMVFDPHAAPGEWPMATMVHNAEASIAKGLTGAYKRLVTRKDERRKGIRLKDWPKFTLAADEWRAIIAGVALPKETGLKPIDVSSTLMREGRKFDIGMVIGAHGTTNAQLGCDGDNKGFLDSFDWIIYLGAEARTMYAKHAPELWPQVPMGTNEQGGTFPLIAICHSPTTGNICLLDMRGFDQMVDTPRQQIAPVAPWQQSPTTQDDELLNTLFSSVTSDIPESRSDTGVTASQREVTPSDSVTQTLVTPGEIAHITMSLSQGLTPSQAAKAMKGCNSRTYKTLLAKVEYVKALIDAGPSPGEQPATEDEDDPDIGPFGYLRER